MNSTERLLAVLTGEIPDRVPISTYELVGWRSDSWENRETSYARLMDFIREKTDCLYMTGIDVANLWEARGGMRVERWDEGEEHWLRVTMRTPKKTLTKLASHVDRVKTVWTRKHWCEDFDDLDAMTSRPWEPGEPDFSALQKVWKELDGTRGLPLISVGDAVITVAECFEFGTWTVLAMTEPDEMVPLWKILHLVGANWTYGSKGWGGENYCMFLAEDESWRHLVQQSTDQAHKLGCKTFLNTE